MNISTKLTLCVCAAVAFGATVAGGTSASAKEANSPVDYVSTLVGTQSKHSLSTGNTYPAVALPWGMNFWTPQTGKCGDGWAYTYDAEKIRGIKQTHQPSPWINDYAQFALMPVTGDVDHEYGELCPRQLSKPYSFSREAKSRE